MKLEPILIPITTPGFPGKRKAVEGENELCQPEESESAGYEVSTMVKVVLKG